MDNAQKKIVNALHTSKVWLEDRTKLKGILSDVIPSDKIHINLMLTAYDEDVLQIFRDNDATLRLMQLVQKIENEYGISHSNACWSIATWCFVNMRDDIGDFISNSIAKESVTSSKQYTDLDDLPEGEMLGEVLNKRYKASDRVIYKVGVDIKEGEYKINVKWKDDNPHYRFSCDYANRPRDLMLCSFYHDQSYIMIKNQQYFEIETQDEEFESIYITRVSDNIGKRINDDDDEDY